MGLRWNTIILGGLGAISPLIYAMNRDIALSLACKSATLSGLSYTLHNAVRNKQFFTKKPLSELKTLGILGITALGLWSLVLHDKTSELPENFQRLLATVDMAWLSQACLHLLNSLYNTSLSFPPIKTITQDNTCPICHGILKEPTSPCPIDSHVFCASCIYQWYHHDDQGNACPLCREELTLRLPRSGKEYISHMANIPESRRVIALTCMVWSTILAMILAQKIANAKSRSPFYCYLFAL